MKRIGMCLLGGVLLGVLISQPALSQATAQISGTVRDQSGAVLPGVEITATQTETGIVRTTVTNETGSYVLPNLTVGPYRLEVSLPGFHTFVQTGIVLQVNGSPVISPVLEVGQVSEQVEVQANASLVETRNSSVGWDSGMPLTVIAGSDRALSGVDVQRVNQVLGNVFLDKSARPSTQFLNPAALAQPASGTLGNLGRGSIRGPANWSFDASLARTFRLRERQRMEVRVEAYNVTNSFRPLISTTGASLNGLSLARNTFGQIRTAQDPRLMQFALKYIF